MSPDVFTSTWASIRANWPEKASTEARDLWFKRFHKVGNDVWQAVVGRILSACEHLPRLNTVERIVEEESGAHRTGGANEIARELQAAGEAVGLGAADVLQVIGRVFGFAEYAAIPADRLQEMRRVIEQTDPELLYLYVDCRQQREADRYCDARGEARSRVMAHMVEEYRARLGIDLDAIKPGCDIDWATFDVREAIRRK